MRQYNHPNLLPLLTSFVVGRHLYLVMPYMAVGRDSGWWVGTVWVVACAPVWL